MFTERDYYNIIETARNDGLAMGMAKGEAEGKIDNINKQDSKNLLYIAIVILMFILSGVLGIVFYKIYLKK